MKRTIIKVTGLTLLLLLLVQCKKDEKNVTIGIDVPLTGSYAWWGHEFKEGVDIFSAKAPELNVVFEDNHGKPNDAVASANKLLNINKVDALITLFAPFSFPIRDIAEKAKIPFISTFNSSTTFTQGYTYSYSDFIYKRHNIAIISQFRD